MRSVRQRTIIGTLGAFVVCLPLLWPRPAALPQPKTFSPAPSPRSAAEVALRRALAFRTRAKIAVSELRSGLEAWDPTGSAAIDAEAWRLQQLALDRDGNLRQAQRWTLRAARLARTRGDAYQAAELQVLLDHETGHHQAEFQDAQRLITLAPGSARARMVLQRAEQCYRRRCRQEGSLSYSPRGEPWVPRTG